MATLKNIIFDLGGVLLDIDYKKTETAFIDLGYTDFRSMYSQFTANELFTKLETGTVDEEDFYAQLAKAHPEDVSEEEIKMAWNKMLLTWREKSLVFLKQISSKYKIYLLSNTNAVHSEAFHRSLKEQTGRDSIDHLFTKAYWSHEINRRKPNADVFEFVAKDAGITPGETLFIDDSSNNIETAAGLGFKTHLLLPGEQVENLVYNKF